MASERKINVKVSFIFLACFEISQLLQFFFALTEHFFCRGRIIAKRINLRIEHVRKSRCLEDAINREAERKRKIAEAKAKGIPTRRLKLKRWVFAAVSLYVLHD